MKKIAICIPHSYQNFQKPFVLSLISLTQSFERYNAKTGNKYELNLFIQNSGAIDFMRNQLAKTAVKAGADYILWLDTDMSFPPDLIARMAKHFEDDAALEAVTGLYTWKQAPFMPHVYTSYNRENGKFRPAGAFPLKESFPVVAAGYGCLMIKSNNYVILEEPWFDMVFDGDQIAVGEDMYFFKKSQPINMICDPTISCAHYVLAGVGIDQYLKYNGFELEENGDIKFDDEKLAKAGEEHMKK